MKITKNLVGQKVTVNGWNDNIYWLITAVGESHFLYEKRIGPNFNDLPYQEEKHNLDGYEWKIWQQTKLYAPAIVCDEEVFKITEDLFDDEEMAKRVCDELFVSWPAVPNKDGFYTVVVDQ